MNAVTLNDFLGRWRLERALNHADGSRGQFEGTAEWRAEADGALYVETGTLSMAGKGQFKAERRYRWDGALNVFFDDGRFFHTVPTLGGKTRHWCQPDMYDGHYSFDTWPDWRVTWHVQGPRKDYTIVSRYRPWSASA